MDPARLERISPFAELQEHERAEIAGCMRDLEVEPGEALAEQGRHAYELFVIEAGTAEVRRNGEAIRTLGEGDVFGEIGLLTTGTRTASVVALTPMRVSALFVREFNAIERRMPPVAKALRETMRERVARTGF